MKKSGTTHSTAINRAVAIPVLVKNKFGEKVVHYNIFADHQ